MTEGLLTVAAACAAYSLFSLPVSARFMQFNVNYRLSTNRGVGLIIRGHAAAGATHTQFCRSELYAALSSGQPLLLAAAQSLVSCESCESAERA